MTPGEIKALVKTLRSAGVLQYKSPDFEITLAPEMAPKPEKILQHIPQKVAGDKEEDKPIPHVVHELTSLLKLDDAALVDRLFPDHTDYGDAEESSATG